MGRRVGGSSRPRPLMARPYLSATIHSIEAALEAAMAAGDKKAIAAIAHELTYRRVPRARDLAARISKEPAGSATTLSAREEGTTKRRTPTRGPTKSSRAPSHKPTIEQGAAIEAFETEGSLRINAFAGTGKTSTLQMLAHSTGRRGLYIAFNRSIVTDAKDKFPSSVGCSTTHALAYRSTAGDFRQTTDKMTGKVNAQKLAEILDLTKPWRIDKTHVLQPRSIAFLILNTVRTYCQSGDETISVKHVPRHGSLLAASDEALEAVKQQALRGAQHVWARMCTPADPIPLGHDGYLKLWALSRPQLPADFILLDEAQDTNPVVLEVLRRQEGQIVYVGDEHQQIYEWRGAVNAMTAMTTDHAVKLTQSFRFGPEIATAATTVLGMLGEKSALVGNAALASRVGPCRPDTILARTNANVMSALVEALNSGRKPHLVGGASELMAMLRGVQDLKGGQPSSVPDFFGFQSWREVVEFAESQEGQHLLTFVNLVESRGEKQLMWALNRTVDEAEADLVLSTAHKAKGREWDNVQLMDDFLAARPPRSDAPEDQAKHDLEVGAELRLFYVAITRAKAIMDVPAPLLEKLGIRITMPQPKKGKMAPRALPPRPEEGPAWSSPQDWTSTPQEVARSSAPEPQPVHRKEARGLLEWLFGRK